MGQEIENRKFTQNDYDQFRQNLENETSQLEEWFKDGVLANDCLMGGFEIEAWLLNKFLYPALVNNEFLEKFDSTLATPELAKFNLEFNNMPRELSGKVFSDFHAELLETSSKASDT
ncbi:MAG: glutamate--cysteine ligase, partial [Gammaproteobacteria bacterium]